MTLYLKYRPQKLKDLDSETVRESLERIVASGKIPHALLFLGPKGTGKTSAARIIAKIVNCEKNKKKLQEPCNRCSQCTSVSNGSNLDVIELDAASNRGIEDVRALRERVALSPARAAKKVYIIDEAHMLTTEASNALLKTLEEPPDHVVFILATTNPEKLIETIRSRATQIIFKKAGPEEIVRSLSRVVAGEKIKIDKASLAIIAKKSGGSFRDAVKTLEQLTSEKRSLKPEAVEEYLNKHAAFNMDEFISSLAAKDAKAALGAIEGAYTKGVLMKDLTEDTLLILRGALLAKMGVGEDDILALSKNDLIILINLFTKAGGELKGALVEQLPVELAVVEWCGEAGGREQEEHPKEEVAPIEKKTEGSVALPKVSAEAQDKISDEIWKQILLSIKPINTSIEALLRATRPVDYDGKTLTLGVYYKFHKERLEETNHRRILEEVVAQVLGQSVIRVICTLTEAPERKAPEEIKKDSVLTEGGDKDIIKVAEEIFGS